MDSTADLSTDLQEFEKAVHGGAALGALGIVLAFHEIPHDLAQIQHDFSDASGLLSRSGFLSALRTFDVKARKRQLPLKKMESQALPAILWLKDDSVVVLAKISGDEALVQAPGNPPQVVKLTDLDAVYMGETVLVARRAPSLKEEIGFGIGWFVPVLMRYKRLLAEVFAASFFLQLFALVTPLIFQVVIDKVLIHQGLTTLNVLIIALISIAVFDAILGFLRTHIMTHTTSRIDVQLGSNLFKHLFSLPIGYFESRPTGQTVARVRELDSVRDFITGNGLTAVLDLMFSFLFFFVMYLFSPTLTWIVAASIPFYVLLSILITPSLRKRIEERFQRGAQNQAFLVESVSGAETLKAMAVEPQVRRRWDDVLASFVKANFKAAVLSAFGSQTVQFINKVLTAILLFMGAHLVIKGEITVGQLVAFNMLAGQISQPIIRLAQLWQDFQQFRLGIQKLGDVLNAKPEVSTGQAPDSASTINGAIELENVTFRYGPNQPEVLRSVDLSIQPGEIIGFVGRSGSGKSTITKLIQRLYVPESGSVKVDGSNTSLLHPSWLRRQIGVVLQENLLFNRSIRDNIALAHPAASMDEVYRSAHLAGAHEFISELPQGYDTILEERGSNLSGGQRQRIAIARALITDPKILILDEATSALDYESERLIQANMAQIVQGRTVLIVAHRLSAVQDADRIYVLDKGQIVEQGAHGQLLMQGGVYADLFGKAR